MAIARCWKAMLGPLPVHLLFLSRPCMSIGGLSVSHKGFHRVATIGFDAAFCVVFWAVCILYFALIVPHSTLHETGV